MHRRRCDDPAAGFARCRTGLATARPVRQHSGIVSRFVRLCVLVFALSSPLAAAAEEGTLRPTYEPRPPAEKPVYTTDYLFAITRSITDSTLVPAAQVPLILLAVPHDIVFLPIEAVAGFFPGD